MKVANILSGKSEMQHKSYLQLRPYPPLNASLLLQSMNYITRPHIDGIVCDPGDAGIDCLLLGVHAHLRSLARQRLLQVLVDPAVYVLRSRQLLPVHEDVLVQVTVGGAHLAPPCSLHVLVLGLEGDWCHALQIPREGVVLVGGGPLHLADGA